MDNKILQRVIADLTDMVELVVKDNAVLMQGLIKREVTERYPDGPVKEVVRRIESYDSEKEELIVTERFVLRQPANFMTLNCSVKDQVEDD